MLVLAAALALSSLAKTTDTIASDVMQADHAPALAICVIQHGRVLVNRAYGTADLESDVPATIDTEFSIASITKQLTAAAILQLADRGKLHLDDDVSAYVTGFPKDRGVTIRRLLNHTAGIHNINTMTAYWAQSGQTTTPEALIAFFRDLPLDFPPGSQYSYSNSGYILLGAVIEKVSGQSYDAYIRANLLDPLHLDAMVYGGTKRLIPHRAHGYRFIEGAFINAQHYDDSQAFSMGGFLSTALDLARWTAALHDGRVLSPAAYDEMITPMTLPDGELLTYGDAVELGSVAGHHLFSHAGGGVGFMSQAIFVREEDLTIVTLSNTIMGGAALDAADRLLRTILGLPAPADMPVSDELAARYVADYVMDGDPVKIVKRDDHLAVVYGDSPPLMLRYQGHGVFAQDGRVSRIHFREKAGLVTGFAVARYGSLLGTASKK